MKKRRKHHFIRRIILIGIIGFLVFLYCWDKEPQRVMYEEKINVSIQK